MSLFTHKHTFQCEFNEKVTIYYHGFDACLNGLDVTIEVSFNAMSQRSNDDDEQHHAKSNYIKRLRILICDE